MTAPTTRELALACYDPRLGKVRGYVAASLDLLCLARLQLYGIPCNSEPLNVIRGAVLRQVISAIVGCEQAGHDMDSAIVAAREAMRNHASADAPPAPAAAPAASGGASGGAGAEPPPYDPQRIAGSKAFPLTCDYCSAWKGIEFEEGRRDTKCVDGRTDYRGEYCDLFHHIRFTALRPPSRCTAPDVVPFCPTPTSPCEDCEHYSQAIGRCKVIP